MTLTSDRYKTTKMNTKMYTLLCHKLPWDITTSHILKTYLLLLIYVSQKSLKWLPGTEIYYNLRDYVNYWKKSSHKHKMKEMSTWQNIQRGTSALYRNCYYIIHITINTEKDELNCVYDTVTNLPLPCESTLWSLQN